MKSRKHQKLSQVELLNVPSYNQGWFDSLCTYYTTAMMLATLFPEYEAKFGQLRGERMSKHGSDDPILSNHSPRGDSQKVLAKWFYKGESIKKAIGILNSLMAKQSESTRFEYAEKSAHDSTLTKTIVPSINEGLPVMMGWSTPDYGDHAVLIRGYWEDKERWLKVNDPGSGDFEISWDSLKKQRKSKFEIGTCDSDSHFGYRPLKLTTEGKEKQQLTTMERWTRDKIYRPVEEDFV